MECDQNILYEKHSIERKRGGRGRGRGRKEKGKIEYSWYPGVEFYIFYLSSEFTCSSMCLLCPMEPNTLNRKPRFSATHQEFTQKSSDTPIFKTIFSTGPYLTERFLLSTVEDSFYGYLLGRVWSHIADYTEMVISPCIINH